MDLILLVLTVAIIGALVLAITKYFQMPPFWANALQLLAIVALILYILRFFNLPNILPGR